MMMMMMHVVTMLSMIVNCNGFSTTLFASRYSNSRVNKVATTTRLMSTLLSQSISSSAPTPSLDDDEEEDDTTRPTSSNLAPDISTSKQGLSYTTTPLNGSDVRVGILMSRWNSDIVQGLYKGVNESLLAAGVIPSNIFTTYVPGAFELPLTAKLLAASKRVDVIICLGCLIKGDTMHFEVISEATANGIMTVGLETYIPIIFGVLTVYNKDQAIIRSVGDKNEGLNWGKSAVEMALARMSAMGVGVTKSTDNTNSNAFVNFSNNTISIKPLTTTSTGTNSTKKSFGF
jgi:6,7-dimethyl-8-ribityllumazine synthase